MKIPEVTEAVCIAVSNEVKRRGVEHLVAGMEHLREEQPVLTLAIGTYIDQFILAHGKYAAESMIRVLVLQYKMIEAQFEVNDLEGTYE